MVRAPEVERNNSRAGSIRSRKISLLELLATKPSRAFAAPQALLKDSTSGQSPRINWTPSIFLRLVTRAHASASTITLTPSHVLSPSLLRNHTVCLPGFRCQAQSLPAWSAPVARSPHACHPLSWHYKRVNPADLSQQHQVAKEHCRLCDTASING